MSMTERSHEELVAAWLLAVGHDPAQLQRCELLHGGVSGSFVYRLEGFPQPLVLKITLASTPPFVRGRAQREVAFYQSLAANLPLTVPQLHGASVAPDGGIALLLAALAPPLPPGAWNHADYTEVARQLARLHAAYWNATAQLAAFPWLRQPRAVESQTVEAAHCAWLTLQQQPSFAELFPTSRQRLLNDLLQRIAHAPANAASLPLTMCHGDCHMDNLLRDAGNGIVWADWQEVGVGYGVDDLSFFAQRASSAGATVPLEEMLATYHDELAVRTGQSVDEHKLRARVAEHELFTRLVHWPHYLTHAEPAKLEAQLERIEQLAAGDFA